MTNDELAAQMIATFLNGADLQKIKPITIGSFKLDPVLLKMIANRVANGELKVKFDASLTSSAMYDSNTNTFKVGFTSATTLPQKGILVHESTHAYFDWLNQTTMKVKDSEAAAYLAQCEYVRANMPPGSDPKDRLEDAGDPNKDKVFAVGWELAGKLLAGTTPTPADFDRLRDAVVVHPFYSGRGDTLAGHNGVPSTPKTLSSDKTKPGIWPIIYEEIGGTKHFQIFPEASVANGTLSILLPTNTKAILLVRTQSSGTMNLLNASTTMAIVGVVVSSSLVPGGFRLVSGPLFDSLSDDLSLWRLRNRTPNPKLTDPVFPQLHFK